LKRIFLASPYTLGDPGTNVHNALVATNDLIDLGFAPFSPLLSHFLHIYHPRPYEDWVVQDNCWLLLCDAVLRLPGESKGAENECRLAIDNKIPVFYNMEELVRFFRRCNNA
jgi:hypothetical protein